MPTAPTEKQLEYAHSIAERLEIELDIEVLDSKEAISEWINDHIDIPSVKQVELAESIAEKINYELSDDQKEDIDFIENFIDENIHHIEQNAPSPKQIRLAKSMLKKKKLLLQKST